ncbi:diaminopimelate decarboxylase, partial [Acinetobacter baumannii]
KELGGYAEVVSEMEVRLALQCGVSPEKIIWNGPIKKEDEIKNFLLQGGNVNVDSIEEAEYIHRIAQNEKKHLNVGIRCN